MARSRSRTEFPLYFRYLPRLLVNTLSSREYQSRPTTELASVSSMTSVGSGGSNSMISKPNTYQLRSDHVLRTHGLRRRIGMLDVLRVSRRMDESGILTYRVCSPSSAELTQVSSRAYRPVGSIASNRPINSFASQPSSPKIFSCPMFTTSPLTMLLSRSYTSPNGCSPLIMTQKYRQPSANKSTAFVRRA